MKLLELIKFLKITTTSANKIVDIHKKIFILKSVVEMKMNTKSTQWFRKAGGSADAIAADKVANSWENSDILPSESYDKGWWGETKRQVDAGYRRFWAKRGVKVN